MDSHVWAVAARHGHGSVAWASAQCDLGDLLLDVDQVDRAIVCYRNATAATAATAAPAAPAAVRQDHLTFRLKLGDALRNAGRLAEAETELRQGAHDRLAFYGREHPAYAFGLVSLAEVLLRRGNA